MFVSTGSRTQINTYANYDPASPLPFVSSNGSVHIAYIAELVSPQLLPTQIFVRELNALGQPVGNEIALSLPTSQFSGGQIAGLEIGLLSDGRYVAAFGDYSSTQSAVRFQFYNASGVQEGAATTITTGTEGNAVSVDIYSLNVNPNGGFFIHSGPSSPGSFSETVNAFSNVGGSLGPVAIISGGFQFLEIAGFANSQPILFGTDGSGHAAVDFPGTAPAVIYSGASTGSVYSFRYAQESDTSIVGAVRSTTFAQVGANNYVSAFAVNLIRFSEASGATLISSVNVLPTNHGNIIQPNGFDFIRLFDGSFALLTGFQSATDGFQSQLRHISQAGLQLGAAIELNVSGTQETQGRLSQLTDGTIMVTYDGKTATSGTNAEVFRELFIIPQPSSVPSAGDDIINGTSGNDVIDSLGGNDTINGLGGDDTLTGGEGVDTLNGGDNNDTLTGGAGADTLNGNAGNDIINFTSIDTVSGGDGDDTLVLTGAYGGNWNGGAGFDIADFRNAITAASQSGGVIFASTERGLGTAFDDHFLAQNGTSATAGKEFFGFAGNDILTGADLNDLLEGGIGNDILDGKIGSDTLTGGDGDDTIVYDAFDLAANVTGGANYDTLQVNNAGAPTNFNLLAQGFERAVVTNSDIAGNQPWSSNIAIYNANWQILTRDTTNDNLDTISEVYTNGLLSTATYRDLGTNDQPYISYTSSFNAAGAVTSVAGTYDDSTSWGTLNDVAGTEAWTSLTTTYAAPVGNAAGIATQQTGTYDNGDNWVYNYSATGSINNFIYYDVGGIADVFNNYTVSYNALGQQISVVGLYDNSNTYTTTYDITNQAWSSITTNFNPTSQALYANTVYDNGDNAVANYINGVLDSLTVYDTGADDQFYQHYTSNYNAAGVLFAVSGINNDGSSFAYLVP